MKFLKGVFAKQSRKFAAILAALGIVFVPITASALTAGDVGPWTSTSNLDTASTTTDAVAYNGYLYNVGGRDSSLNALDIVQYAPLSSNGSVGTWITSPNTLPSGQWRSSIVENNGYLYSLGGINGGGQIASVYYAPINSNGSVGTWTSTTPLPQATQSAGATVYGNHIFIFGGGQSGGNVNTVISAPINSNGSVGTWTSTTPLPQAERRQKAIEYNGYAYVMGGLTSSTSTSIFSAKLNNNGTVGTWTTLPVTLPASTIDFSISENNGYAYLIGGHDGSNYLSSIYFAPLAAGGALGAWTQSSNSLPVGEEGIGSAVYNNVLYVIGGNNTNNALANVYYASLMVASNSGAANAQTTTGSSGVGSPDTGYGMPGNGKLTAMVILCSITITGTGVSLLYRSKYITRM